MWAQDPNAWAHLPFIWALFPYAHGEFKGVQFSREDAEDEAALAVLWAMAEKWLLTEQDVEAVAAFPAYPAIIDAKANASRQQ